MESVARGFFKTEKIGLTLRVFHTTSGALVGTVVFVPDPNWPRYEVFDWRFVSVAVEIEEPKAHKVMAEVVNEWLKEVLPKLGDE